MEAIKNLWALWLGLTIGGGICLAFYLIQWIKVVLEFPDSDDKDEISFKKYFKKLAPMAISAIVVAISIILLIIAAIIH